MIEFLDGKICLHVGDCRDVLSTLAENSIDACVTDPPYGLGFMGKDWDRGVPGVAFWHAVYRVLKPGAHLLAFGGTRTFHRMACAIEDAGFDIRDTIMWVYGSGFPKSHDVSKGIDRRRDDSTDVEAVRGWLEQQRRRAGITRKAVNEALGFADNGGGLMSSWTTNRTLRAVPQWKQWLQLKSLLNFDDEMDAEVWRLNGRKGTPGEAWHQREVMRIATRHGNVERRGDGDQGISYGDGWGGFTTLSTPATAAARQWEGWGTALKPAVELIILARKPLSEGTVAANVLKWGTGALNIGACRVEGPPRTTHSAGNIRTVQGNPYLGTVNANHRQDEELMSVGDVRTAPAGRWPANLVHDGSEEVLAGFPDTTSGDNGGGLLRKGLRGNNAPQIDFIRKGDSGSAARFFYTAKADADERIGSKHPTVKPLDLMQWLVRLICRRGGTVLDPFAGTGTTGEAAWREGMNAVLIEAEPQYQADIHRRMALALTGPDTRLYEAIKARGLVEGPGPLFERCSDVTDPA
jgi:DNA modification methylase